MPKEQQPPSPTQQHPQVDIDTLRVELFQGLRDAAVRILLKLSEKEARMRQLCPTCQKPMAESPHKAL